MIAMKRLGCLSLAAYVIVWAVLVTMYALAWLTDFEREATR